MRSYQFENDRQKLIIPNYNADKDDGVYNCNAAQHSSFETLSINVTGYCTSLSSSLLIFCSARPRITVMEGPTNGFSHEGQSIQLKCGAIGKPVPTYTWSFEVIGHSIICVSRLANARMHRYACVCVYPFSQIHPICQHK